MKTRHLYLEDPVMNFLSDHSLCIPIGQVIFLVILVSICLLARSHKLGILISYTFVFYWGFIYKSDYFLDAFGNNSVGLYMYFIFGAFMVSMSLYGFFHEDKISQVGVGKRKGERRKLFIKVPEDTTVSEDIAVPEDTTARPSSPYLRQVQKRPARRLRGGGLTIPEGM